MQGTGSSDVNSYMDRSLELRYIFKSDVLLRQTFIRQLHIDYWLFMAFWYTYSKQSGSTFPHISYFISHSCETKKREP